MVAPRNGRCSRRRHDAGPSAAVGDETAGDRRVVSGAADEVAADMMVDAVVVEVEFGQWLQRLVSTYDAITYTCRYRVGTGSWLERSASGSSPG